MTAPCPSVRALLAWHKMMLETVAATCDDAAMVPGSLQKAYGTWRRLYSFHHPAGTPYPGGRQLADDCRRLAHEIGLLLDEETL